MTIVQTHKSKSNYYLKRNYVYVHKEIHWQKKEFLSNILLSFYFSRGSFKGLPPFSSLIPKMLVHVWVTRSLPHFLSSAAYWACLNESIDYSMRYFLNSWLLSPTNVQSVLDIDWEKNTVWLFSFVTFHDNITQKVV